MRTCTIALLAGLATLFATGCVSKPVAHHSDDGLGHPGFDTTFGERPSRDWEHQVYYARALTLMTNDERTVCFQQEDDAARDHYLRSIGSDARIDLEYRIKPQHGQPFDPPRALRKLYGDDIQWGATTHCGVIDIWLASRFNGVTRVVMTFHVSDGKLIESRSYLQQEWSRRESVWRECCRIKIELSGVLGAGMTVAATRDAIARLHTAGGDVLLAEDPEKSSMYDREDWQWTREFDDDHLVIHLVFYSGVLNSWECHPSR
ncbi:MAG: hypothetical protein AB7K09_19815 [Planctomycetota bacterium]